MHESLDRDFRDPDYAALYLNDALQEGSPEEFLLALRNVIRATHGMSQIAAETEMGRESLYNTKSDLEKLITDPLVVPSWLTL